MIEAALLPRCSTCKQVPADGIAGGLWLCGAFLCADCLADLSAWTNEDESYRALKSTLDRLWQRPDWRRHLASGGRP
ncbi:sigma factor G inhibitor Gin [Heliomicrobium gestii]|nr:sigma factor G inhibitor Gin [Heliomicrobium gestii]